MTKVAPRALVAVLALALAGVVGGCGGGSSPGPSFPASPVEGVIVAIDATSLSDVRGFTLLLPSGTTMTFRLGTLENPTEFPPGHLKEHEATSVPIRVSFRLEAGVPVAYRLADASPSSSAAGPSAT